MLDDFFLAVKVNIGPDAAPLIVEVLKRNPVRKHVVEIVSVVLHSENALRPIYYYHFVRIASGDSETHGLQQYIRLRNSDSSGNTAEEHHSRDSRCEHLVDQFDGR